MKKLFQKVARSPLFFGISYLLCIPIFALIYSYIPQIKTSPELNFIESLYFSAVTITTLGYGDINPISKEAMLVAGSEAVLGIVIIGLFLNSIAQRSRHYQTAALEERIIDLISSLLMHHTFVMQDITLKKIPQPNIRFKILKEDEIKDNMKGVFFNNNIPSMLTRTTVGESVARSLKKILKNIDDLLKYIEYLHPDLIKIISNVESDPHIERWLYEYEAKPELSIFGTMVDPNTHDISSYSSTFYNIHIMYHHLQNFIESEFSHNAHVCKILMSNCIAHQHEFKKGLSYARKLYKHPEYSREAYFLSIVANLKIRKFKKARWALSRYVSIGSEGRDFVKNQIQQHYSYVTTEELNNL